MPETTPAEMAREIHNAGLRLVIAVTGGGSGAISTLLAVPGASRSVLAAVVPYAEAALVEWLGGRPDEFCSAATARAMAMAAYQKAVQYDPTGGKLCGVACTASLASDRPKRGPHRAHLAWQTMGVTACVSIELEKGRRTRADEESVVAALLINLIAEACDMPARLHVPLTAVEAPHSERIEAPPPWQDLLAGRLAAARVRGPATPGTPLVLLPGAFNPLHHGHTRMAEIARARLGHPVAYEISMINVDKPPLDFLEISERLRCYAAEQEVWLTRAPRFVDKAAIFPGATFVVGADTLVRIGRERYYGGRAAMEQAIAEIAARGCRFLVFGRLDDGRFVTLHELQLPASLAALCQEVPADEFRDDISSTALRQQRS
ncbi:MAG: CinA family protein [Pirellulales bacterium]